MIESQGNNQRYIEIVSPTFKGEWLVDILQEAKPAITSGHHIYPADEKGSHTQGFFLLDRIAKKRFVELIVNDMAHWAHNAGPKFDVIIAPNQPSVRILIGELGSRLGKSVAYLEYFHTGRFGNRIVEGDIRNGDRVLICNGISFQGNCVGNKLPGVAKEYGGEIAGIAVFAKNNTSLLKDLHAQFGQSFYSTIEINIPIYSKNTCPYCKESDPTPWTEIET
jgi:orotate phosphoribosyltransferase